MNPAPSAYPWPEGRWLRAVMLMDLQGSITGADGRSGSLSGPADRAVLLGIRSLADVVIIGASTLRAERYRPMVAKPELAQARAAAGLHPALQLVVVSRSLDLPWNEPVFSDSDRTPVVVTVASPEPEALSRARANAEVLQCPSDDVDPRWLLDELAARGHRRMICEGGRNLLHSFAAAGVVDEWDLTLAPSAGGSEYALADQRREDGFEFLRYVRTARA